MMTILGLWPEVFFMQILVTFWRLNPISPGGRGICPKLDNGGVSALYSEFHAPILLQIQSSAETKWKIQLHHKIYNRKWNGFEKNPLLRYLTSPLSSWRQSLESLFSSWYLNWCLHLAIISERLFSRSFAVCSAIASFSVVQSAHLWVDGL